MHVAATQMTQALADGGRNMSAGTVAKVLAAGALEQAPTALGAELTGAGAEWVGDQMPEATLSCELATSSC